MASLSACDLAPDYHPPSYLYPNGWRGHGVMTDGRPADGTPHGDWWKMFKDPELDALEGRMLLVNPDLQAQAEAFTQSRDIARETEAQLYPQVTGNAGGAKYKSSLTRLWRSSSTALTYESSEFYSGAATWEPDFWDRIRNNTRLQKNLAQASAADYANTRLSLEAELASDYIGLRGLDAQIAVYADSIRYYQTAVQITKLRQSGAIAAGLDVSRAEDQLYSTMASQSNAVAQRQVLEHAIAVLTNTVPAAFHVVPETSQNMRFGNVYVAAGLPSQLLERRPDVAAAERNMAAASRAIGVSRAAFYPDVTFSASGGFMNNGFDLANLANSMWQYGVQAVEPLFTGGLRRAALQRAWSQYRQSADNYRSVVLSAFQDVEDGLSQTGQFKVQQERQAQAVAAALRTQRMTMALYTGGLTNYLDVVVAQQAALVARIDEVQAQTIQLQATVRLVRALGGGWDRSELPSIKSIDPIHALQYEGLHHPLPAGGIETHESPADGDLGGNYALPQVAGGLTAPSQGR
ncbi:secretion system type I outer membrane efflux pump lipoprotein NodT [Neoasaia chiangmaiensis NBRC 101099]|uniref:Secretion protein n=1 Tax=Neoasaia chiangmaiensis TaxID=320497 RepID=A0A1U9KUL2_9PROT|nr:efflux transporter outer membrane subunit [Neoasaia chiangmaiensis]AQS89340.1 secretion protein [Neoasaia chiangmaiensis]GBR42101.1 secretion system type I outer membrane efflux pump lipoprotein NodT [Neoasaia chiangmaiensis NBRC 101099]